MRDDRPSKISAHAGSGNESELGSEHGDRKRHLVNEVYKKTHNPGAELVALTTEEVRTMFGSEPRWVLGLLKAVNAHHSTLKPTKLLPLRKNALIAQCEAFQA